MESTETEDSLLTCSICFEHFNDPVNLPCAHTYCRQCLLDFSTKGEQPDVNRINWRGAACRYTEQTRRVLECPQCRDVTILDGKGIKALPKNCLIANMVARLEQQRNANAVPSIPCDGCEVAPPRPAFKTCVQCNLSYCNQCLKELHPKRGTLAAHTIVEASEKLQRLDSGNGAGDSASAGQKSVEQFCMQCQIVISQNVVADHRGSGHIVVDLRQAQSQKIASLERSILNLESLKRDLGRAMAAMEIDLATTKEEEKRILCEITHGMDRIGNILQEKQTKMRADTKHGYTGYFDQSEEELDKMRQKHFQVTGLIGEAKSLLESSTTPSHLVMNGLSLEYRMSVVQEENEISRRVARPNNVLPDVTEALKTMEDGLQHASNHHKSSPEFTNFQKKQPGTSQNDRTAEDKACDGKVVILTSEARWGDNGEGAAIFLRWTHMTGQEFDMKVQCEQNGMRSTHETSIGVRKKWCTTYDLLCETPYSVSVWVKDKPDTEATVNVVTLPKLNNEIVMDVRNASDDVQVRQDGTFMGSDDVNWDFGVQPLVKIPGTVGVSQLSRCCNYWAVEVRLDMEKLSQASLENAFDIGICYDGNVDRVNDLVKNYNAYTCAAVKSAKKTAQLEYSCEGQTMPYVTNLTWASHFELHLGFFLNKQLKTFTVLDYDKDTILFTFNNVKLAKPHKPVFAIYNTITTNIQVILVERATVPSVVYSKLL